MYEAPSAGHLIVAVISAGAIIAFGVLVVGIIGWFIGGPRPPK